jgi:aminopeptidase N
MTWYPVNDHPSDKATYTLIFTVPEPYAAASNGLLVDTVSADGTTTFVWEMTEPMASYLATVVVAELERVEYPGPEDIVLRDYYPPELATEPPASFALIAEMLAVFEPLFGPYPYDAYGHVVVPDFPAALETQTMTVFGDGWLDEFYAEYVVAHELAHAWFGNSVTPATWQDIWLNEGLATFAEWVWLEHVWGREIMLGRVQDIYDELGPYTVSTADPGAARLLGDAVYLRGALTIHALRAEVGDDLLFEILRTWTARYAHSTATTADFIALAEEVAQRDLGWVFDRWLFETRLPRRVPQL